MDISWLIAGCWAVFIIWWGISALSAKKYAKRNMASLGVRLLIAALLVIAFSVTSVQHTFFHWQQSFTNPILQVIGVLLTAIGIGIAIWARVYLGRNWGMPVTLKQNAELVTRGPYASIRHPIYSGIIVAMLGTSCVFVYWFPALIIFAIYFYISGKMEEKIMLGEFPDQYPAYMKRTKMLIPYLL